MRTVTLAHYYTIPAVQQLADKVGDSLELAMYARNCNADLIVFAGVRFMAETAKILNPNARVILPDWGATCSLVTMTNIDQLTKWRAKYAEYVHVAYINSSAEHKAISDWIVTSRNVDDIINHIYSSGKKVIYSPDRNMGAYLNAQYGYDMPLWSAVCEVHDRFSAEKLKDMLNDIKNTSALAKPAYVIAHPESPLPVLHLADFIGSTHALLKWIIEYSGPKDAIILVSTEDGILYNMGIARPDLTIKQAPIYSGCRCNSCPYMKKNTVDAVLNAQNGDGVEINMDLDLMNRAAVPIFRMLDWQAAQQ